MSNVSSLHAKRCKDVFSVLNLTHPLLLSKHHEYLQQASALYTLPTEISAPFQYAEKDSSAFLLPTHLCLTSAVASQNKKHIYKLALQGEG